MNFTLAVIAGAAGLLVTGSAVAMAWLTLHQLREGRNQAPSISPMVQGVFRSLLRWTFFDYLLIIIFVIGSLFLFADVLAVMRDSASYPLYHFGYLICGFAFMVFGMLFMVLRLSLVLSLVRVQFVFPVPDQNNQPNQAEQPKERIKGGEKRFETKLANYIGK